MNYFLLVLIKNIKKTNTRIGKKTGIKNPIKL